MLRKGLTVRGMPIVALALLIWGAGSAFADTWKGKELEALWRKAALKAGPFHIQPAIWLTNFGYDSNVLYAPNNPIKDYTLTAGPAVTVYLPISRRFVLSGSASPQYVFYAKTKEQRAWNYYLTGAAALNLRQVFLSVDWLYTDARQRWNTEIDLRPRLKEDGLGASVLLQTSRRTSLAFAWKLLKFDYGNAIFDIFNIPQELNRKESYFDLSAYYQITSRMKYFIDLEYGRYDFDFAQTALLKNSSSKAAYAGFEFSPLGRIWGKIRVGYKQFDVLSTEGIDYRGLVGDSQVSVRLAKPFVIRAAYRRDVTFSLWYNNPYFLESMPSVGASFYLLKFVRLDYDFSFGRNNYAVAQVVGVGESVKRLDDYRIHSAGIYFRVKKKTAIGFIMSWWSRLSNIAFEDDTRLFYGMNLIYDF